MEQMQIIAILFSVSLTLYVLWIIQRQRLKEEYSLMWLGTGVVFVIFSVWRQGLEMLADLLGIAYPPAALFMILLVGIILILIQFSMIISRLSERSKVMAQDFALLEEEVQRLKNQLEAFTPTGKVPDTLSPAAEAETDVPA
jgi:hypothetical protein